MSSKYVIEIAAELTGEETLGELDAISSGLLDAGKDAKFFQDAVKTLNVDLGAAKAAVASVSSELAAAKTITAAANAELADGSAEYAQLERAAMNAAKAAERAALKNAGVVPPEMLARADAAAGAVNGHAAKLLALEKSAKLAAAAENKLNVELGAAKAQQDAVAKSIKNVDVLNSHVNKTIADQAKEWRVLGGVLGQLPGPLGSIGRGFAAGEAAEAKFAGRFGESSGAALKLGLGLAGLTAAVVAVTAAVVVGAAKLATWAVGLADSARAAGLSQEAVEAVNPAVAALHDELTGMSKTTGQTVPALDKLAQSLTDAGVSSDRLKDSLNVAALAETALGQGGAAQYLALEKAATDAQKAVDDAAKSSGGAVSAELTSKLDEARAAAAAFANTATTKLGGVVHRQLQGLDSAGDRLTTGLAGIFGGLDIDPVLVGVNKLVDLFDKNSVAGKALKTLFEGIFQPLIDNAADAATLVEAFYLGVLIGATKIYIALKPAISAVAELFGFDEPGTIDWFRTLTAVGEALAPVLLVIAAVVGGVLLVAFGAIGAAIAVNVAVWYGLIKVVGFVVDAFVAVYNYLTQTPILQIAKDIASGFVTAFTAIPSMLLGVFKSAGSAVLGYLTSIDLASIGTNMMLGLVRGITGGIGAVVSAVSNAMSSAISAAKNVLGIHSPSSVMSDEIMRDGVVAGVVEGADDGTKDVQDAYSNLLQPAPANDNSEALKQAQLSGDAAAVSALQGQSSPVDGAGAPPAGGDGAASVSSAGAAPAGGAGASFGPGTVFNFYGLPDAKGAADAFEEMLTAAIQGDAAKLGAAKATAA